MQDRAALSKFVRSGTESARREGKRLRDLRRCGKCSYCDGEDKPWPGFEVARAACALANGAGGLLIIGVEERPPRSGRFRLEETACRNFHRYEKDWITKTLLDRTLPWVLHSVREVLSENGSPQAFIVEVPASLQLHGLRMDANGNYLYPVRSAASSPEMIPSQLEFRVRTKASVAVSVEFRGAMFRSIWQLFYAVLDRPKERQRWDFNVNWLLRNDPYAIAKLEPGLDSWPYFPEIERAVLDIPAKMAVHSTPRDIAMQIENLRWIGDYLIHKDLDASELRLQAAARLLSATHEKLYDYLDPFDVIGDLAEEKRSAVRRRFMTYEESFGSVFERLGAEFGLKLIDEQTRRSAVIGLVDALSLLLPSAMKVLHFYESLVTEYGPVAIGTEPVYFRPRGSRARQRS